MKRLLLALVAVPAILVGLLSMHVLTMPEGTPPHSASTGMHAEDHHESPGAGHCDGPCGTGHDMLDMACILALLLTTLVLMLTVALRSTGTWRVAALALLTRALSPAPPHPPSLLVLSISRT